MHRHVCEEADDGLRAIEMCKAAPHQYDVILMDNHMPNCSGPQATAAIRSLGFKGIMIGVTGNCLPEEITEFLSFGLNSVLHKPVTYKTILKCIMDVMAATDSAFIRKEVLLASNGAVSTNVGTISGLAV
jgi:CheY-like chemotaxis protein